LISGVNTGNGNALAPPPLPHVSYENKCGREKGKMGECKNSKINANSEKNKGQV
jgi:hypothetical protein